MVSKIFQVIHHVISIAAVAYSILTGEGQLYTFMVLVSETTTPGINLRWYFSKLECIMPEMTCLINIVCIYGLL